MPAARRWPSAPRRAKPALCRFNCGGIPPKQFGCRSACLKYVRELSGLSPVASFDSIAHGGQKMIDQSLIRRLLLGAATDLGLDREQRVAERPQCRALIGNQLSGPLQRQLELPARLRIFTTEPGRDATRMGRPHPWPGSGEIVHVKRLVLAEQRLDVRRAADDRAIARQYLD